MAEEGAPMATFDTWGTLGYADSYPRTPLRVQVTRRNAKLFSFLCVPARVRAARRRALRGEKENPY